jgi:hypothetical protein
MAVHIAHPLDGRAICRFQQGDEVSPDPNGDRCASCRAELVKHPQLAAQVARAAGIRVGDITLGAPDTTLRMRAARAKRDKTKHKNLHEIERRRELAARMKS